MIRTAVQSDIAAVSAIYSHIHALSKQGKISTGWIEGLYPTLLTAQSALDNSELFVFDDDGVISAAAIINQKQSDTYYKCNWLYPASDSEVMVLHTLVVDPSYSGRGIGCRFVDFYEKYAADNGCVVLRMDTNEINTGARRLYAKLGYRESAIIPCIFNGIPDVRLVMLEKLIPQQ